jgi:hypothetical protein
MSYDDRKKLFQTAFAGKDAHGNRSGVYLMDWHQKDKRRIYYAIKGVLGEEESFLPMTFEEYISVYGIEDQDLADPAIREERRKEFENIKLDMSSEGEKYSDEHQGHASVVKNLLTMDINLILCYFQD